MPLLARPFPTLRTWARSSDVAVLMSFSPVITAFSSLFVSSRPGNFSFIVDVLRNISVSRTSSRPAEFRRSSCFVSTRRIFVSVAIRAYSWSERRAACDFSSAPWVTVSVLSSSMVPFISATESLNSSEVLIRMLFLCRTDCMSLWWERSCLQMLDTILRVSSTASDAGCCGCSESSGVRSK